MRRRYPHRGSRLGRRDPQARVRDERGLNYGDPVLAVALSPDGRHVATAGYTGTVQIWDVDSGRLVRTLAGHTGDVLVALYSRDGTRLATGGTDGTARIWDARTGVQLLVLYGHAAQVDDLAFTGDGRRLATGSEDGTARVWDVKPGGGRDWLTLSAHPAGVTSVDFSADGRRLVTTGDLPSVDSFRERVSTWDARSGRLVDSHVLVSDTGMTPPGSAGQAAQSARQLHVSDLPRRYNPERRVHISIPAASSPDGSVAAVAVTTASAVSGSIQLLDASSGTVRHTLSARHGSVRSIAFDMRGDSIATGYSDGTAIVWDVKSGRALWTFAAHNGLVETLAFNPDGRLLATGGDDTTATLWDLKTGKRLLTLRGHTRALTDLAFSPDGTQLATASLDGTVRVYVLPIDALMAISRSRLTRGWTTVECEQYLPGGHCPRRP